jgi:hypothetical protein
MVWVPDSRTPNRIAEAPLTDLAVEALREQVGISGGETLPAPEWRELTVHQKTLKTVDIPRCEEPGGTLPDLRSAV